MEIERFRQVQFMLYNISGFGFIQFLTESLKCALGSDTAKFPNGFADLNVIEELAEGSLSSMAGIVLFVVLYRLSLSGHVEDYSQEVERSWIFFGASVGYAFMAWFAGPILHEYLGVSDVRWEPFS